jgi:hypothetical protein
MIGRVQQLHSDVGKQLEIIDRLIGFLLETPPSPEHLQGQLMLLKGFVERATQTLVDDET